VADRSPRKLAVILHADVVGSTALVQRDEALAHERIRDAFHRFSETIEFYNGHPLELRGDALVAEFDRVSDAVEASLAFQADNTRFNSTLGDDIRPTLRVGISLGEVVVADNTVTGEGIVLAQRLEQLASAGGVCIQGAVYEAVPGRLPFDYESLGEQALKGISEPVRAFAVSLKSGEVIPPPEAHVASTEAQRGRQKRRWIVTAATAVLAICASGLAWFQPWVPREEPASIERMAFPLPDKPSIVVLPFDNLSGDPEQEYFADGITEDLTTDLSKIFGLFVIARNSAFTYKGRAVKPEQVARELGVRYVLEGSVRRSRDQVRINAQLIDATTGGHLWAERYDGSLSNIFSLQDSVTEKIVHALAVNLTSAEQAEHAQEETDNPQAYDVFLKGWEHYQRRTPEHYAKASEYFEQAIELDPGYSRAFAALASINWKSHYEGWPSSLFYRSSMDRATLRSWKIIQEKGLEEPGISSYSRAKEYLAVAMDKPTLLARQVAAHINLWRGRHEEAVGEAKRAIALDINDADSYVTLAEVLIFSGEPQKALDSIEYARRLDPHNEAYHSYLSGVAEFQMERFETAAAALEKAMELNPELLSFREELGSSCLPCTPLAAAYTYLGRKQEAQSLVQRMREKRGTSNVDYEMMWWPYKEAVDRDRLAKGLLEAGLPETLSDIHKTGPGDGGMNASGQ
jgi:TolB-like protein/class 3 adenylate cyclase/cytochrome c-type biogenesis protein CcmH/NrfG